MTNSIFSVNSPSLNGRWLYREEQIDHGPDVDVDMQEYQEERIACAWAESSIPVDIVAMPYITA